MYMYSGIVFNKKKIW